MNPFDLSNFIKDIDAKVPDIDPTPDTAEEEIFAQAIAAQGGLEKQYEDWKKNMIKEVGEEMFSMILRSAEVNAKSVQDLKLLVEEDVKLLVSERQRLNHMKAIAISNKLEEYRSFFDNHDEIRECLKLNAETTYNVIGMLISVAGSTSSLNGFHADRPGPICEHYGVPSEIGEQFERQYKLAKHALITTETAELTEGVRKALTVSDHGMDPEAEEIADIIIRCLDYAFLFNVDVAAALLRKLSYNTTRTFKHGKKL